MNGVVITMKKSNLELMRGLRGSWTINPRTRIHDNNPKRNKKKQRQDAGKIEKEVMKEYL